MNLNMSQDQLKELEKIQRNDHNKEFTTKSWFSHDPSDDTKNLYPIPNSAILTNSNLKQNPGY